MKSFKLLLILGLTLLVLAACGGGDNGPKGPQEVFQPDWWDLQGNPDYIYVYGSAEKVSETMSQDAAKANAYTEAAQYIESHVKAMIKNYEQEVGLENPTITALTSKAVKVVSNANFKGTSVSLRKTYIMENGRYKTFVRLQVPKNEVNKNMLDEIKKEEALYNEFKASQAFQELEHELGE